MSLEQILSETNKLLTGILASLQAPATPSVVGVTVTATEAPAQATEASVTPPGAVEGQSVAGKKTYVWLKRSQKGFIVQKGELLPVPGPDCVAVGKTKWEELCAKYGLDVETGDKPKAAPAPAPVDDFDDEPTVTASVDDLDEPVKDEFDIDLDPPAAVDPVQELKDKLIEVVKRTGQNELVRKIFERLGVQNADQLKAEHVEKGLQICEAAIKKYDK